MQINAPWITKDGFFDVTRYPSEHLIQQALGKNISSYRSGVILLSVKAEKGDREAKEFLFNLLAKDSVNKKKREELVEALGNIETKECVDLLHTELKKVESTNANRSYINLIIKTLSRMPEKLVIPVFGALSDDKIFSYRMRKKFQGIVEYSKEAYYW